MRRKNTRAAAKASPEKPKEEKSPKKTRRHSKRHKPTSSESESEDEVSVSSNDNITPTAGELWTVTQTEQSNNDIGKIKICLARPSPATPERSERASKRLRNKPAVNMEDSPPEEKPMRRTRRSRGGSSPSKKEDLLPQQQQQQPPQQQPEPDVSEEKKGKGKSKGKHKSKINEQAAHVVVVDDERTEMQSEISENVQVTAQSPQTVDNSDDAECVERDMNRFEDDSNKCGAEPEPEPDSQDTNDNIVDVANNDLSNNNVTNDDNDEEVVPVDEQSIDGEDTSIKQIESSITSGDVSMQEVSHFDASSTLNDTKPEELLQEVKETIKDEPLLQQHPKHEVKSEEMKHESPSDDETIVKKQEVVNSKTELPEIEVKPTKTEDVKAENANSTADSPQIQEENLKIEVVPEEKYKKEDIPPVDEVQIQKEEVQIQKEEVQIQKEEVQEKIEPETPPKVEESSPREEQETPEDDSKREPTPPPSPEPQIPEKEKSPEREPSPEAEKRTRRKRRFEKTSENDEDTATKQQISTSDKEDAAEQEEKTQSVKKIAETLEEMPKRTEKMIESSEKIARITDKLEKRQEEKSKTSNHQKETQENKEENAQQIPRVPLSRLWGESTTNPNILLVSSAKLLEMYPALTLVEESSVKLESTPRERPQKQKEATKTSVLERRVSKDEKSEHKLEREDSTTSTNTETSSIALNRKISIVEDEASSLRPPPSPAKHDKSSVLFITNLVRPFTVKQLRGLLERTGKIVDDGFWTDRIKSKCYIQYETEDEAEATRNAIHGVLWPIGNGKKLIIDFATVDDLENAKNPPVVVPKPVAAAAIASEPEKENQEPPKKTNMDAMEMKTDVTSPQWDEKEARVRRGRSISEERKRRYSQSRRSRSVSQEIKKKRRDEPQQRAMDDLFRKTEAMPSIYWQPLQPEEIALKQQQRLERMEAHKRKMDAQSRPRRYNDRPRGGGGGPYRRRY